MKVYHRYIHIISINKNINNIEIWHKQFIIMIGLL